MFDSLRNTLAPNNIHEIWWIKSVKKHVTTLLIHDWLPILNCWQLTCIYTTYNCVHWMTFRYIDVLETLNYSISSAIKDILLPFSICYLCISQSLDLYKDKWCFEMSNSIWMLFKILWLSGTRFWGLFYVFFLNIWYQEVIYVCRL